MLEKEGSPERSLKEKEASLERNMFTVIRRIDFVLMAVTVVEREESQGRRAQERAAVFKNEISTTEAKERVARRAKERAALHQYNNKMQTMEMLVEKAARVEKGKSTTLERRARNVVVATFSTKNVPSSRHLQTKCSKGLVVLVPINFEIH
jgi:hypothetical protein